MSTTKDSANQRATTSTPEQVLLDKIEAEIARLQEKRPALHDRIDRATNILIVHLSCPRQRPIRVRVRDGRATFLVNGSKGAVYTVSPTSWSCTCPDFHRSGLSICKHGLACWLLWRASRPVPKIRECNGCQARHPRRELVEITHEHESLTWFPGDLLCGTCSDRTGVER